MAESFNLSLLIYKLTSRFPAEEKFGLTSQIRRSSVSIPSNIAEGHSRGSRRDYRHFVVVAFGSGAELETQLLLAKHLGYFDQIGYEKINSLLTEVMKMLNVLITKLSSPNT